MASKRNVRKRQCERKTKFSGMGEAIAHAQNLRRKSRQTYDAYGCPHCGGYHVGRRTNVVKQEIQRRNNG